ncbi:putative ABC transporter permease [Candidatus Saccharibacteria bacterium]|nr:putative ABC transporter permease [Candidatus Saccharibacteria bacterium]
MNPFDVFVRIVLYFTIFAVMGYIIEALNSLIREKKMSNRGFLFGPYLPIYGFAGLLMIGIWQCIPHDNYVLTFFMAMIIGAGLEYITSYILEKIFHLRWWDYSKSDRFNIHGRICLRNTLIFGVAGLLFCYILLPTVDNAIVFLPVGLQIAIALIMMGIYLLDFIASSYANSKVKNMEELSKVVGDQTREIKKNAKKVIKSVVGQRRRRK